MKRKIVDVLLITLVFTTCVVKVAPNAGLSDKNEQKIEENATENKRGISSVIEETLEVNDISGKTKHIEEKVKESLIEAESKYEVKVQQEGWTTENLNVRESPSTDANILEILPFNTYIKYYKYNDKWAEISYDNGQAYVSLNYISDQECNFVMYDIPEYEGFKSWMSYKKITDTSSKQYKLQQIASTGFGGVRVVDSRMCVAIGTAFNADIGTYIDLILEDGFIIPCIVADIKNPKHTDANNVFTITGKNKKTICCTEFIVDPDKLNANAKKTGNISDCNELWAECVRSIVIYDKNVL